MTRALRIARRLGVLAASASALAAAAHAQNLAARARAMTSGTLRFSYPVKPGVCGNGSDNVSVNNNRLYSGTSSSSNRKRGESEVVCDNGPARIALDIDHGRVAALRYYVGGRWSGGAEGEDLGSIPAAVAAEYFQSLFETADTKVAERAIVPAIIADGGDPYPALLRMARDRERPSQIRNSAVFWLGQEAGEVATRGLSAIVASEDDREVRKQAIFALSLQHTTSSVDVLIDVVRTNRDPELRKTALFWLGQSNSPKALALFEELINKR
jgi:hypothetical protein